MLETTLKKPVFLQSKFLAFFLLFNIKNVKNEDFDQLLECAAPKHWSKYTTPEH